MADKGELTRIFETRWRQLDGPELEAEYKFHPARRFRFDYCHPETKTAIEVEGGIWQGGRHTSPTGYTNDCIKYNLAAGLGFKVFRFTRSMLENDPAGHLLPVIRLIRDLAR